MVSMSVLMPQVYNASVVVYNRYTSGILETEYYVGTLFDRVCIELTKGANIQKSGMSDASACKLKIPNTSDLPKPYVPPELWLKKTTEEREKFFTLNDGNGDFFAVSKMLSLNIDFNLPVGLVESRNYDGGFFEFLKEEYGYSFLISSVDEGKLIPKFEVYGK